MFVTIVSATIPYHYAIYQILTAMLVMEKATWDRLAKVDMEEIVKPGIHKLLTPILLETQTNGPRMLIQILLKLETSAGTLTVSSPGLIVTQWMVM